MAIKTFNPTTKSRRGMSVIDFKKSLTRSKPKKSLTINRHKHSGRDRFGQVSIRHQGGGSKRQLRLISSLQLFVGQEALVKSIEYDPNRSGFISLVELPDKKCVYILCPDKLKVGEKVVCQDKASFKIGNRLKLKNIPTGTEIHDIELQENRGGKIAKSAGSYAVVAAQPESDGVNRHYVQVKMPSGEIRLVHAECFASIGKVSNIDHDSIKLGKAGRSRWMGIRPSVRGSVMSPKSHPHGGGEGKSPIGLSHPKTPWGKPALGYRTRKNQRTSRFIIKRRK